MSLPARKSRWCWRELRASPVLAPNAGRISCAGWRGCPTSRSPTVRPRGRCNSSCAEKSRRCRSRALLISPPNAPASRRNVETLRNAYTRWHESKGASVDTWMEILADSIKFDSMAAGAAHVAYLTNYSHKDALRSYFDGLSKNWSMIHFTVTEYIAQGDVV